MNITSKELVETIIAKQEAHDTVSGLIERNLELEQVFEALQPLLFELSTILYKENDEPVSLSKLIEDSVTMLKGQPT